MDVGAVPSQGFVTGKIQNGKMQSMFGCAKGDQLGGSRGFRWKKSNREGPEERGPKWQARSESCTIGSGEAVSICFPHPCFLRFLTKKLIRKLRLVAGMRKLWHKAVR